MALLFVRILDIGFFLFCALRYENHEVESNPNTIKFTIEFNYLSHPDINAGILLSN